MHPVWCTKTQPQVSKETQEGEGKYPVLQKEKHPSAEMNITMMFTGTKERVEFTSEHVYEVPMEPNSNQKDVNQSIHKPEQPQDVNQANEAPQQQQKRKVSPEAEEPRKLK